jgi:hypothetical protein
MGAVPYSLCAFLKIRGEMVKLIVQLIFIGIIIQVAIIMLKQWHYVAIVLGLSILVVMATLHSAKQTKVQRVDLPPMETIEHPNSEPGVRDNDPVEKPQQETNSGYVYVLINSSFDQMVKIGKTRRDPRDRMAELSAATGVPTPYALAHFEAVVDCDKAERIVHEKLSASRVNRGREFFSVSVAQAIEAVRDAKSKLEAGS